MAVLAGPRQSTLLGVDQALSGNMADDDPGCLHVGECWACAEVTCGWDV